MIKSKVTESMSIRGALVQQCWALNLRAARVEQTSELVQQQQAAEVESRDLDCNQTASSCSRLHTDCSQLHRSALRFSYPPPSIRPSRAYPLLYSVHLHKVDSSQGPKRLPRPLSALCPTLSLCPAFLDISVPKVTGKMYRHDPKL